MTIDRSSVKYITFFLILVFAGFLIRILNLTNLPVFADEAIYIRWSQVMANESTLRFLPLSDGKQPLFMWILMFIVDKLGDPLFAGRLISVFAGTFTSIGVFLVSQYLFKSYKVSFIALTFSIISPFFVFFDRLALVDSLLTMFGVWVFLLGIATVKTKRLDFALLTGFALGFAGLTKSPALFFALLLPLTWTLSIIPTKKKDRITHFLQLCGLLLTSYVVAFMMYNILRLGPNFHMLALRNYDYVYPYAHVLENFLDPFIGHSRGILTYFMILVPLPVALLALLGFTNISTMPRRIILLALWGILPLLVIAEYSKVVTARYVLFAIPYFCILAASAFLTPRKQLKKLAQILLVFAIITCLYSDFKIITDVGSAPLPSGDRSGYLEEWTAGHGIREISQYLKNESKNLPPNVNIVVGTEGYFGTLPDGLQMYMQDVPNVTVIGIGLGISEIPNSLIESIDTNNKSYLVINKSRLKGDPDKMGLNLIAQFDKELRSPESNEYKTLGPRETLYFFEVIRK